MISDHYRRNRADLADAITKLTLEIEEKRAQLRALETARAAMTKLVSSYDKVIAEG